MSRLDKPARVGKFTSSQIYKLTLEGRTKGTSGEKALTYIAEKRYEKRIGRSLDLEKAGRPALWGHYNESRVHSMLGTSYQLIEDRTIQHPAIDFFCGTPDCLNERENVVGDIKCYEPRKFCQYVDALTRAKESGDMAELKKDFAQEFWQLIANSILLNTKHIEAIVYIPYFSELQAIRESVDDLDSEDDKRKYGFIKHSHYNELPYIADGCYYKNLNIFRFVASEDDKDFLIGKIVEAGKILNQ